MPQILKSPLLLPNGVFPGNLFSPPGGTFLHDTSIVKHLGMVLVNGIFIVTCVRYSEIRFVMLMVSYCCDVKSMSVATMILG